MQPAEVQPRCSRDAAEMQPRCSRDVAGRPRVQRPHAKQAARSPPLSSPGAPLRERWRQPRHTTSTGRRLGEPSDLDGPLLLLASEASKGMTGSRSTATPDSSPPPPHATLLGRLVHPHSGGSRPQAPASSSMTDRSTPRSSEPSSWWYWGCGRCNTLYYPASRDVRREAKRQFDVMPRCSLSFYDYDMCCENEQRSPSASCTRSYGMMCIVSICLSYLKH